ncbi:MAG: hypothetical protein DRO11_08745 [Methanobacteriota archaeon]|nr:MAG: hypothetical protein DRO11_08745 [Euryarchaeota archaeon]
MAKDLPEGKRLFMTHYPHGKKFVLGFYDDPAGERDLLTAHFVAFVDLLKHFPTAKTIIRLRRRSENALPLLLSTIPPAARPHTAVILSVDNIWYPNDIARLFSISCETAVALYRSGILPIFFLGIGSVLHLPRIRRNLRYLSIFLAAQPEPTRSAISNFCFDFYEFYNRKLTLPPQDIPPAPVYYRGVVHNEATKLVDYAKRNINAKKVKLLVCPLYSMSLKFRRFRHFLMCPLTRKGPLL